MSRCLGLWHRLVCAPRFLFLFVLCLPQSPPLSLSPTLLLLLLLRLLAVLLVQGSKGLLEGLGRRHCCVGGRPVVFLRVVVVGQLHHSRLLLQLLDMNHLGFRGGSSGS